MTVFNRTGLASAGDQTGQRTAEPPGLSRRDPESAGQRPDRLEAQLL